MIFIAASLIVWLPAIIGFGSCLIAIRQKMQLPTTIDPAHLIFIPLAGLALLGVIATLLNFFVPINSIIVLILCISGWIAFIFSSRYFLFRIPPFSLIIFVLLLLTYTAYSFQKPITHPDSGLYHLQAIRWITDSKLPFGLANLHSRLGFNSLWFPIAAALRVPYLQGEAVPLAHAVLFFAYGLAIGGVAFTFRFKKNITLSNIFLIFTGIVWLVFAKWEFGNSPAPDIPIILLTLLSTFSSIKALESSGEWIYYSFVTFFIVLFAITIKLSAIPLLLAPIIVLSWNLYKRKDQFYTYKQTLRTLLIISTGVMSLLLLPWLVRGIALSGCLAYPSSVGCYPTLSWAVPISVVNSEAAWVRSWARLPHSPPEVVLADWNWLIPWLDTFLTRNAFRTVVSLIFFGSVLSWSAIGRETQTFKRNNFYILLGLTPFIGIIFWFFTAPNIRFGEGYLWALGLIIFSIGVYEFSWVYQLVNFDRILLVIFAAIILFYADGLGLIGHRELYHRYKDLLLNWPTIPVAEVQENLTKEGVQIISPTSGGQCWNADIPCTPQFDANLKVRMDEAGVLQAFYR